MKRAIGLLSLMILGCATRQAGVESDEVAEQVASRIDALRAEKKIPGLALAIVRHRKVIAAKGFGYADLAQRIAVTPETPFNIASVSKPISAVVALKLAEDCALDLDRPMQRYSGFADLCKQATSDGGIFFSDYRCDDERLTLRRVLSMTANGEPGTRFWYNPPSYSWASGPMAEVAGRPFSELVEAYVFRPAGCATPRASIASCHCARSSPGSSRFRITSTRPSSRRFVVAADARPARHFLMA